MGYIFKWHIQIMIKYMHDESTQFPNCTIIYSILLQLKPYILVNMYDFYSNGEIVYWMASPCNLKIIQFFIWKWICCIKNYTFGDHVWFSSTRQKKKYVPNVGNVGVWIDHSLKFWNNKINPRKVKTISVHRLISLTWMSPPMGIRTWHFKSA